VNDRPTAERLTVDQIEELEFLRVCGHADDDEAGFAACIRSDHCSEAVLDDIGADWIDAHFDGILASFAALAAAEAQLTQMATDWNEDKGCCRGCKAALVAAEARIAELRCDRDEWEVLCDAERERADAPVHVPRLRLRRQ
jgi:hypothetical protein